MSTSVVLRCVLEGLLFGSRLSIPPCGFGHGVVDFAYPINMRAFIVNLPEDQHTYKYHQYMFFRLLIPSHWIPYFKTRFVILVHFLPNVPIYMFYQDVYF
ncbi:hypothetical protein AVEN_25974-1 [Araneus ventricosus]|uniref:Uncharacterized protein n=1 Tax=Araneus ventricosus TaxID=182803 RepID=A0A4Y2FHX8_ARAVE|nr:hypothetical protein AVEN_25974-1 [Araneus ventricosus]